MLTFRGWCPFQAGEADPEDKKAQCLLTQMQIRRFFFFKCWLRVGKNISRWPGCKFRPGRSPKSGSPILGICLLDSTSMLSNGRVANIICGYITGQACSKHHPTWSSSAKGEILVSFDRDLKGEISDPTGAWVAIGYRSSRPSKVLFGFSNRWGPKHFMTSRHDDFVGR